MSSAAALARPDAAAPAAAGVAVRVTGARLLVESLVREGATTVFGYPGGAIMPVYDALPGSGLRHVLVRHEQAAAFAADAGNQTLQPAALVVLRPVHPKAIGGLAQTRALDAGASIGPHVDELGGVAEAQPQLASARPLDPRRQSGLRLEIGARPGRRGLRRRRRPGFVKDRREQLAGRLVRGREVVEHHHHRDAFGGRIQAIAAPAAQAAAMGGDGAPKIAPARQAKAIAGRRPVREGDRPAEAPVEAARIVARRVDVLFPGDHVVETGAHPGVPGPHDAVFGGAKAAGLRSFVAFRPIGHGAGVRRQERGLHPHSLEDPGSQQLGEAAAGAMLQDIAQDTEVLVAIGIARPRRELQRARTADHPRRLPLAEWRFRRRAVQHRHGPVVAQARLVVAKMQRAGGGGLQPGQAGAHIGVERRRVGKGVEHQRTGELLGDRAHPEQGLGGEGDPPFRIRPAPGVARDHLALAQHRDRPARAWIGARQPVENALQSLMQGRGHPVHSPVGRATKGERRA